MSVNLVNGPEGRLKIEGYQNKSSSKTCLDRREREREEAKQKNLYDKQLVTFSYHVSIYLAYVRRKRCDGEYLGLEILMDLRAFYYYY
jgi:uncharacterized protein (UPF0305 family)